MYKIAQVGKFVEDIQLYFILKKAFIKTVKHVKYLYWDDILS